MASVALVTSVNQVYFNKYGIRLASSFLEQVDKAIPLRIYSEASVEGVPPYLPPEKCEGRISFCDLFGRTKLAEFLKMATPIVEAKIGKVSSDPEQRLANLKYNYRWDALTFSKKAFSIIDALATPEARYLIWVDSDVVFFKFVPELFLVSLFQGHDIVYFGRKNFHSETGIIGFDTESPRTKEFYSGLREIWESGKVLGLARGWTDCDGFDAVLERMMGTNSIKARNISPPRQSHVIAYSVLSPYLDHMKGKRKIPGGSPERKRFLSGGRP